MMTSFESGVHSGELSNVSLSRMFVSDADSGDFQFRRGELVGESVPVIYSGAQGVQHRR